MHEASLARNLLDQAFRVQRDHPETRIATVEIELGPMSGVEPMLFKMAFDRLVSEEESDAIELVIKEVELQAVCQACRRQSELRDFKFVCPYCQSAKLNIVQGDCVRLMSVDLMPLEHV